MTDIYPVRIKKKKKSLPKKIIKLKRRNLLGVFFGCFWLFNIPSYVTAESVFWICPLWKLLFLNWKFSAFFLNRKNGTFYAEFVGKIYFYVIKWVSGYWMFHRIWKIVWKGSLLFFCYATFFFCHTFFSIVYYANQLALIDFGIM